jgi:hypothetical protein
MDWVAFLEANHIDFVTSGPNTRRGQISIRCPWCGPDDPSEHLSISLTKDAFGCWRNAKHAGRKPYSLVAALLGCSFSQARLIVGQHSAADPETLEDAITALGGQAEAVQRDELPTSLPPEFRQIKPTGLTGRFWRYLESRGFDDVGTLIAQYDLLCCQHGRWKDRIIIPIHQPNGELAGWTARAIQATTHAPRYLSSSAAIKTVVFNEHDLRHGGETLFVTEGPFDAIKVDYYGGPHGHRATCMFGVNPTTEQIAALQMLIKKFDKVRILFDEGAFDNALHLGDCLSGSKVRIAELPVGVKDPGGLNPKQVKDLILVAS